MLLEVIALDAADARHAEEGGADRIELVSDMTAGGLRERHLPALLAAGIDAFHSGSAVRAGSAFANPIDPDLVRHVRRLLADRAVERDDGAPRPGSA